MNEVEMTNLLGELCSLGKIIPVRTKHAWEGIRLSTNGKNAVSVYSFPTAYELLKAIATKLRNIHQDLIDDAKKANTLSEEGFKVFENALKRTEPDNIKDAQRIEEYLGLFVGWDSDFVLS